VTNDEEEESSSLLLPPLEVVCFGMSSLWVSSVDVKGAGGGGGGEGAVMNLADEGDAMWEIIS
jgi:hypothetical protein